MLGRSGGRPAECQFAVPSLGLCLARSLLMHGTLLPLVLHGLVCSVSVMVSLAPQLSLKCIFFSRCPPLPSAGYFLSPHFIFPVLTEVHRSLTLLLSKHPPEEGMPLSQRGIAVSPFFPTPLIYYTYISLTVPGRVLTPENISASCWWPGH